MRAESSVNIVRHLIHEGKPLGKLTVFFIFMIYIFLDIQSQAPFGNQP